MEMPVFSPKRREVMPLGWADISDLIPLLNTPEVQRLEQSTQLGVNYKVFPTATHKRLGHSLGVVEMTTRLIQELFRRDFFPESERAQLMQDLRIAALLHDLGHAPYGHPSEYVAKFLEMGYDHKVKTAELIRQLDSTIRKCGSSSDRIVQLLDEKNGAPEGKLVYGSPTGGDKILYLLQDKYFAGVLDVSETVDPPTLFGYSCWTGKELAIARQGIPAFEVLGRLFMNMYLHCYFKPECLAAQRLWEKGIEVYMRETGLSVREMYEMREFELESALAASDVRMVRECHKRLSEFGSLEAAVTLKVRGVESKKTPVGDSPKEVGIRPEHATGLSEFYENPLNRTKLEKKLAVQYSLSEDGVVVTTTPDLPKLVPKDIPVVDETGVDAGTIFEQSPEHKESLQRLARKGYSFIVWAPTNARERVAAGYKEVCAIIEAESKVELTYDVGARERKLFTEPAK